MEGLQELKNENELLKRLVRFQFLTLGFYGTSYNYEHEIQYPDGNWRLGIVEDGGKRAREADKLIDFLGFVRDDIRSWKSPKMCSNCGGALDSIAAYPCICDNPQVGGLDKKEFRKAKLSY